jgi:hypothetical protein
MNGTILEGIVTTISENGNVNIAPMGPMVDDSMSRLVLRPFRTSTTYQNIRRCGEGVFHVTDDVELLARAAVGTVEPAWPMADAVVVRGRLLANACRWYEFRAVDIDDRSERSEIPCQVVHRGRIRDFFGFCRAKHAVVEAAILATRTKFLPADEMLQSYRQLSVLVDKTGGPQERRAFDHLYSYVKGVIAASDPSRP